MRSVCRNHGKPIRKTLHSCCMPVVPLHMSWLPQCWLSSNLPSQIRPLKPWVPLGPYLSERSAVSLLRSCSGQHVQLHNKGWKGSSPSHPARAGPAQTLWGDGGSGEPVGLLPAVSGLAPCTALVGVLGCQPQPHCRVPCLHPARGHWDAWGAQIQDQELCWDLCPRPFPRQGLDCRRVWEAV